MNKPFIIAEMSGNHNGDINRALSLITEAKNAGADAVKLQTYTADTITINHNSEDFIVKEGLWKGKKLYDLYNEAHTPWDWHPALFKKGKELGIEIFSSPFDKTAVNFLEELNVPRYKIASFEIIDLPLVKYIAQTGKPIIISTGLSSLEEINDAVTIARDNGCSDITLLHCISSYPAAIEDSNLSTMLELKKRFDGCRIGLSDHSLGTTVAIAAVALGAEVIEKHFTLSRSDGGVDSGFSLEPIELKELCEQTDACSKAIGTVNFSRTQQEINNKIFRRSLYVVDNIKQGETFTSRNIRSIRPGHGLSPAMYEYVIGKKARQECQYGTPLSIELIEDN